ncbi:MAG: alkaline shock response membrane anchor protein AmaP [Candidatus Omnitrophota bacterium]
MKFFTYLGVSFNTFLTLVIGLLLILFALQIITIEHITAALYFIEGQQLAIGLIGFLFILTGFALSQSILGKIQREKTVAFTNPQGEVIVSLTAVEDLIRRIISIIPEVKDSRPTVIAGKKGISIDLRLTLRTEVNIPEFTSRLQELVRSRIQDILGVEETISIRIFVVKISVDEPRKKKEAQHQEDEPIIPFQGYGKNL